MRRTKNKKRQLARMKYHVKRFQDSQYIIFQTFWLTLRKIATLSNPADKNINMGVDPIDCEPTDSTTARQTKRPCKGPRERYSGGPGGRANPTRKLRPLSAPTARTHAIFLCLTRAARHISCLSSPQATSRGRPLSSPDTPFESVQFSSVSSARRCNSHAFAWE